MLARLLPLGDAALIAHEMAQMGHPVPVQALSSQSFAAKLMDVPQAIAAALTAWLQHQETTCWWYHALGVGAATADVLFGGSGNLLTALRQEADRTASLQPVRAALDAARDIQEHGPTHVRLGAQVLALGQRTYVMGILNVTPDSFSDGGLYLQPDQAIKHAEEMLADGADIIDVGGQSSRPGAMPIPAEVEHQRVIPVIGEIVKRYGALVSVDTYRASIAEASLDAGAVLINDISAMRFDTQMAALIARRKAAVVLMHMQGTPQTMQHAPAYRHVIDEVYSFLAARLDWAIQQGITRQQIVLDPGFGFGKTIEHNQALLRSLEHFRALGQPLLVGTSRKWDRLKGTLVSVIYATLRGAAIVRVHNVKPVVQAVRLVDSLEHALP
jgi:dihydropteroate synthase